MLLVCFEPLRFDCLQKTQISRAKPRALAGVIPLLILAQLFISIHTPAQKITQLELGIVGETQNPCQFGSNSGVLLTMKRCNSMAGIPYLLQSFERELLAERALAAFSNHSRVSILSSPMRSPVKVLPLCFISCSIGSYSVYANFMSYFCCLRLLFFF